METTAEWVRDFPIEVGLYWFYGWLYGDWDINPPALSLVTVKPCSNGTYAYADGTFIMRGETLGYYTKAEPPVPPELVWYKDLKKSDV